ncbi:hypothetical protein Nstercoris_02001 [Nitrosomonas stercoris]|uniref:HTH cro/C1-type domain-containing protein n=1 Tax=Nitrosomonas stercoris TaxID=1444684 RepID=A0A4Y1YNK8_9PROT|nr:hypothetical protein Nstercoris_02001 [Nitrosomonas stercoris]
MELRNYIETAERKAGKQIELARILDVSAAHIRMAKTGKRGLPDAVCIVIANYIGINPLHVIAASNLVTEKDEKRIEIYKSCFNSKDAKEGQDGFILC